MRKFFIISAIFKISSKFSPPFSIPIHFSAGKRFVDEDDIIPDALDTIPGDIELLSPAKKPEEAARTIDDDGGHLSLWDTDIDISYQPQSASIADIDDLLTAKVPEPALHKHPSLLHLMSPPGRPMHPGCDKTSQYRKICRRRY